MRNLLLSLALLLSAVFSWSQDSAKKLVPSNLTQAQPALTIGSEDGPSSVLSGSMALSVIFDDKMARSASGNAESDVQYLFAPSILYKEVRQKARWNVQYAPGVTFNQRSSVGTGSSQAFSGTIEFQPASRLTLDIRQDYLRTSNPVDLAESPLPSMGFINSGNQSIIAPDTIRTTLTSGLNINYAFTRHSSIGASGNFSKYDYDARTNTQTSNGLLGSHTTVGSLYYSRQFSRRSSFGLHYAFTDMTIEAGQPRAQVHSLFYFHTIALSSRSALILYGGPEWVTSPNVLTTASGVGSPETRVERSEWSAAFGGMYSWTSRRWAIGLDASHRTSDGAGVVQAATMTSGAATLSQKLTRRWTAQSSIRFTSNEALEWASTQAELRSMIASVGFRHSLSDTLEFDIAYNRIYQDTARVTNTVGNHNQMQFSVRYVFARRLGKKG